MSWHLLEVVLYAQFHVSTNFYSSLASKSFPLRIYLQYNAFHTCHFPYNQGRNLNAKSHTNPRNIMAYGANNGLDITIK